MSGFRYYNKLAWNDWTKEELLLLFSGHLCGCALQESGLLDTVSTSHLGSDSVDVLHTDLDQGSCMFVLQDFCHTTEDDEERVADFIHQMEHTFNLVYGRERMLVEIVSAFDMISSTTA